MDYKYFGNWKDTQGKLSFEKQLQDKGWLQLDHMASVVAYRETLDMLQEIRSSERYRAGKGAGCLLASNPADAQEPGAGHMPVAC